jgi:hypothetical protein
MAGTFIPWKLLFDSFLLSIANSPRTLPAAPTYKHHFIFIQDGFGIALKLPPAVPELLPRPSA